MVRLVRCDVDEHDSNVQIMFASSPTEARHVNTECTVGCVGCVVDTSLFFFSFFSILQRAWMPRAGRQAEWRGQYSVTVDGYVKWKASGCLTWCLLTWKQRGDSVFSHQIPLATALLDILSVRVLGCVYVGSSDSHLTWVLDLQMMASVAKWINFQF